MRDPRFKSVTFNNRKKQIIFIYSSGKHITLPYSRLEINKNIQQARVDSETQQRSVELIYSDGSRDYLPYDEPLALAKDPEFLLQTHIEVLTADIKEALQKKRISKRYLAEQLGTSDNQIQRLLNPNILNKNLSQLYRIAALVGLQVEIRSQAA